ncbi:hypothetical protein OROHE_021476 [Orobanche hederae]
MDDPRTNIGRGSNLTEGSHVECDASVMDGESGAFGAVGAQPVLCVIHDILCHYYKKGLLSRFVNAVIGGTHIKALVDTGATHNFMREGMAKALKLTVTPTSGSIKSVNTQAKPVTGECRQPSSSKHVKLYLRLRLNFGNLLDTSVESEGSLDFNSWLPTASIENLNYRSNLDQSPPPPVKYSEECVTEAGCCSVNTPSSVKVALQRGIFLKNADAVVRRRII